MFDNLATLADVMLASAGQLEDKSLKRKIDLARAKISQTILPITPEMSSKRTMQVSTKGCLFFFHHSIVDHVTLKSWLT